MTQISVQERILRRLGSPRPGISQQRALELIEVQLIEIECREHKATATGEELEEALIRAETYESDNAKLMDRVGSLMDAIYEADKVGFNDDSIVNLRKTLHTAMKLTKYDPEEKRWG